MANPIKIKAEVSKITQYGSQVYKLDFILEKKFPRFKAGQFLHLTLEEFDPSTGYWPESRVFSIASSSEDRKTVSIVYSVKGKYTAKMQSQLKEGQKVWLKAPYGDFIIPNHINTDETAVLIAGGTGISPFIPFLKEITSSQKIIINYGLRKPDLIIFNDEIDAISYMKNVKLNVYFEESAENVDLNDSFEVKKGRLSIDSIMEDCKDNTKYKYFISGPPVMIESFQSQLKVAGISENNIVIDEWG